MNETSEKPENAENAENTETTSDERGVELQATQAAVVQTLPMETLPEHGLGTPPAEAADPEAVRAAIELLEWLDADQARVMAVDEDLRRRLLVAAGRVARPGRDDRKRRVKEERRARKREKRRADEHLLNKTADGLTRCPRCRRHVVDLVDYDNAPTTFTSC